MVGDDTEDSLILKSRMVWRMTMVCQDLLKCDVKIKKDVKTHLKLLISGIIIIRDGEFWWTNNGGNNLRASMELEENWN